MISRRLFFAALFAALRTRPRHKIYRVCRWRFNDELVRPYAGAHYPSDYRVEYL